MSLSIVMPVLDEEDAIGPALAALAPLRATGAELIVADGGSADETLRHALPLCDLAVPAPRGRGSQMNAGARRARGDVLVFLHVDTRLPPQELLGLEPRLLASGRDWGRFDVRIEGRSRLLPLVARAMNLRSRMTGIATGDQAMFVRRDAFERAGGFPDIALMEDIALSKKLRALGWPLCLRGPAVTSGRRWDDNGALRTIVRMWRLRAAFFFGADPSALARCYGYRPREDQR